MPQVEEFLDPAWLLRQTCDGRQELAVADGALPDVEFAGAIRSEHRECLVLLSLVFAPPVPDDPGVVARLILVENVGYISVFVERGFVSWKFSV